MTPRDRYLLRTYGITEDQYNDLLEEQEGACAVCLQKPREGRRLCVDHVHDPDPSRRVVRGLLCSYCNYRVIGRHRDYRLLRRAADYLESPPAPHGWFVPKKKRKRRKRRKKKCPT